MQDVRHFSGVQGFLGWSPGGPRRSIAGGVTITGKVGTIKWGESPAWYTAAGIQGFVVTRSEEGVWRLTGNVVLENAYNLAQRPLTFVTTVGPEQRRWPIESMELNKDTKQVTARLGALKE